MNCGVHRIGVAGMKAMPRSVGSEGKGGGTSIVECGGYDGGVDSGIALTYLGSGGAVLSGEAEDGTKLNMRTNDDKTVDQKDDKMNRAFQHNKGHPEKPVRVVRGTDAGKLSRAVKDSGGIPAATRAGFPWAPASAAARALLFVANHRAPKWVTTLAVPGTYGPYDDGTDPQWLSSYPRALGGYRELDYFFRGKRGGIQAFRPVGLDKVYRYDGLYRLKDWKFEAAPWSKPTRVLRAFFFEFERLADDGGKQAPGAWTPAGSVAERSTVALWEAIVRARVRDVLPVDAVAEFCRQPVPSREADAAMIDFARATGGQTDEAYGVWWGGDLRAGQIFALARADGETPPLPILCEDAALLQAMNLDVANAAAWARLRLAGVARRAHFWHVVPEAVRAVEEAFECGITRDFPIEPVTLPCGHNFECEMIEMHVSTRVEEGKIANCPLCAAELLGGVEAWRGAALHRRINTALLAAVATLKGVGAAPPAPLPPPEPTPKKAKRAAKAAVDKNI